MAWLLLIVVCGGAPVHAAVAHAFGRQQGVAAPLQDRAAVQDHAQSPPLPPSPSPSPSLPLLPPFLRPPPFPLRAAATREFPPVSRAAAAQMCLNFVVPAEVGGNEAFLRAQGTGPLALNDADDVRADAIEDVGAGGSGGGGMSGSGGGGWGGGGSMPAATPPLVPLACVIEPFLSDCHGHGFASILWQTVGNMAACAALGGVPTVSWVAGADEFTPPANGTNFWEWWFEPVHAGVALPGRARHLACMGAQNPDLPGLRAHRRAAWRLVVPQPALARRFEGFWRERVQQQPPPPPPPPAAAGGRKGGGKGQGRQGLRAAALVLAVHVRGTDKREYMSRDGRMHETPDVAGRKMFLALGDWLRAAEKAWRAMRAAEAAAAAAARRAARPVRVLVLSDNDEAVGAFRWLFDGITALRRQRLFDGVAAAEAGFGGIAGTTTVVAVNGVIRNPRYADICCNRVGQDAAGARAQGADVLTDILLMSRADLLLHTVSRLVDCAAGFNPALRTRWVFAGEGGDAADRRWWAAAAARVGRAPPSVPGRLPAAMVPWMERNVARKEARLEREREGVHAALDVCGAGVSKAGRAALLDSEEAICLVKLSRWSRCSSVRRGKVVEVKAFVDKLVVAGIAPPPPATTAVSDGAEGGA